MIPNKWVTVNDNAFKNETYETVMNTGNVTQAIAELQSPSANEIAFLEDKDHEMVIFFK